MEKKLRVLFIVAVLLCPLFPVLGQQPSFEENFTRIESKLEVLADTLVPGLNETANFSVVNTPVQDLLRAVAETHGLNVSVDPNIQARITNNFTNVKVKNLLEFVVREYKLDVKFINTILSFHPFQVPVVRQEVKPKILNILYSEDADKLTLDLQQDSLSVFVRQLTQNSNKNVIVSPKVQDRLLKGYINNMPFDQALNRIAFANNLEVEKTDDGFYIINNLLGKEGDIEGMGPGNQRNAAGRRNQPGRESGNYQPSNIQNLRVTPVFGRDTLVTIDAINVPIKDVIQEASLAMGKDYIFFSEPAGNTVSHVKNISYDELLRYLLHGTTHTFHKQANVYMLGDRGQEGFRSTRLVRFQFRSAEEIEKVIPAEISKGVQITPFKELNGIILSGSEARIVEIEAFLKAIDQPVPNIMIEVIVVDVRKGRTIQTGLSGFLGDSAVATGGKVFPGVDVALSSRSINEVLNTLEATGVVNLGRVRPNFYMTLKAMEANEDIDVRSTPKLSTLNGHEAELSIGQTVYYLEQTQNVTGGVNPIVTSAQRFNTVEANLSIKITPIVSGDDHVTLTIDAEFSDFIPPQVENAPPGNATRKFVSQIRVMNEDMIVLGGLEEARREKSSNGLPLIARIPILKWIFSQRSTVKRDDRLMVFIRPTVVY